jgi:hypothetical protein
MHSYLPPRGVRFNDYLFSEPTRLSGWTPPRFPGLFAILVDDSEWAPRRFQPVCFGEFGNNARQPLLYSEYARLVSVAGARTLFAAVLPMPFSTTAQRVALRDELVWAYNPAWQGNPGKAGPGELAGRVEELEKKHQEQTAQVLLLLSNMNMAFEPQSMPARRRIGFLPELA